VREDGKFLKIAVYPIPLTEDVVKDLVRQIDKGKGHVLNNVTMLWHANGNHALELIFQRPTPIQHETQTITTPQPEKPPIEEVAITPTTPAIITKPTEEAKPPRPSKKKLKEEGEKK